ncbi:fused isobutyryl-CoA mutase/GTPase IcmF [Silvanigrella aquatica]|uniref:Fused isobutyryl-CoA mutase n=1 Tax=Silvanigrella aquatica TaxID=1915309 RepID=A0A1L4D2C7_9BACT|nr:fused isobutyryl-CoA mutase/GTPase IcmF [Silvanigrella aquatica]APJ04359.1 methylmalonyl-CoA mutase [Silvanigrella aquatica]
METSFQYKLKNKVRFVTATALFDGHDASINIIRRLLQQAGAEVIHLGHNRSVGEVVQAAIQEDVHAVSVSSYQGGHVEYFKYMREMLDKGGRPDIKIFGGGGGVIIAKEIEELHKSGITRIYSPEDGLKMGLEGMISDMLAKSDFPLDRWPEGLENRKILANDHLRFARALTIIENDIKRLPSEVQKQVESGKKIKENKKINNPPLVLGVTGTGGAGKSSLTDEIIRRFTFEYPERKICIFSVDPSKRKTGGALLGDRIRMNAINQENVFMHSFATRGSKSELSSVTLEALCLAREAGFDFIIVETSGIGQGDTGILDVSDLSLYVMTSEFGAATQLEKIDMLDFADLIAINKFDRRGSEDAFRDVKTTIRRSRYSGNRSLSEENYPVFGTIASKFNDDGVNGIYRELLKLLEEKCPSISWQPRIQIKTSKKSSNVAPIIAQNRTNYLSEIAQTIKDYHKQTEELTLNSTHIFALEKTKKLLNDSLLNEKFEKEINAQWEMIPTSVANELKSWQSIKENYESDAFKYEVRGKKYEVVTYSVSLCGLKIKKLYLPQSENYGDIIKFLRYENLPGNFPFTAGVFPFKRSDEDPKRQFAGEGGPARTNNRFHFLTKNDPAKRLSTAFDSVTLYGDEPAKRPDIYGKIGESGVSIASLNDMKILYSGFDLCDPNTSVSMTINGPAPIILAFFFNTAIDQQIEKEEKSKGRKVTPQEFENIKKYTLETVRGTVQADILKEDQAQNTCIFSIDFALKMMGDIQEYFVKNKVKNYYSVSISGYHIAEAGANPITQLAFTLANGFTYVEYYLSRGMDIDDFAANLAFFFSNGMDPEYSVIGRVARRIWAIALRDKYKANERSQKLKYHIQTSGRSLHAQEMNFNDIRTTLQALLALSDNCNSLHTNAYDEAVTTPTEESVRRSMAIQLILAREFGMLKNENPMQGSYFIESLTNAVEEAVLQEFDRISSRGGVLGAMETQYQRGKIQEESLYYETLKHTGKLPLIGVNTYLNPNEDENTVPHEIQLSRASYEEKNEQLTRLEEFKSTYQENVQKALKRLQETVLSNGNIFEELLYTTRYASLGEITTALYAVGGQYRRAM